MGEMEYQTLRVLSAFENILECFSTRSIDSEAGPALADRVTLEAPQQAQAPTPAYATLVKRLNIAGIRSDYRAGRLVFSFEPPAGPVLELARAIPHPWMPERELTVIGVFNGAAEYAEVLKANTRAQRMIDGKMPESLVQSTVQQLEDAVDRLFRALLVRDQLKVRSRASFSGRTVISPGPELHLDQLGLAEEIAWELFGPMVTREMGDRRGTAERSPDAAKVLDKIMARSWVILNRAPTLMPTSLLAFHPVRHADRVIRINPLVCMAMNADFDGDQAAIHLPVTEAAQQEAGEVLSVAAHVRRDSGLLRLFCPEMEAVWGLAELSRTPEGRKEIERLAGISVAGPGGHVTHDTISDALYAVHDRDGVEAALGCSERLMHRGFEFARESGASVSPFIGSSVLFPPEPANEERQSWLGYAEACAERIAARRDFDSDDIGPQLLSLRAGARGNLKQLGCLVGPWGTVVDTENQPRHIIRRGLVEGKTAEETYACVVGARKGLAQVALRLSDAREAYEAHGLKAPLPSKGFDVLARAMRAENPGVVFAVAAAGGEIDPLQDLDSRLFVGLRPL